MEDVMAFPETWSTTWDLSATIAPWGEQTDVRIVTYGTPAPAGSKKGFRTPSGHTLVVDDNKRTKPWQAAVRAEAAEVMGGRALLDGALEATCTFYVRRPKGHFGKRGLLPSAPAWPTTKPDATKLWRAVEDALKGIVWRDDAQVVVEHVTKCYGEPERCEVTVRRIG